MPTPRRCTPGNTSTSSTTRPSGTSTSFPPKPRTDMLAVIVRRLLVTVPMVLVVVSLTWGLIRLAPGNFCSGEKPLPPAIVKNIRDKCGLDKPWYVQYGKMLSNTLHGDFGSSLKYQGQ